MKTPLFPELFIPPAEMELNDAVEGMFCDYPEPVIPEFIEVPPLTGDSSKSPKGACKRKKDRKTPDYSRIRSGIESAQSLLFKHGGGSASELPDGLATALGELERITEQIQSQPTTFIDEIGRLERELKKGSPSITGGMEVSKTKFLKEMYYLRYCMRNDH